MKLVLNDFYTDKEYDMPQLRKANKSQTVENATSKSKTTTTILYGSETSKALTNFTLSDLKMPRAFLWGISHSKKRLCASQSRVRFASCG